MKSKMLLALACLLMVATLVISPASAKKATYKAVGTLEEYVNPTTAVVYCGIWGIRIESGEVEFKAAYLELNLAEEIPGTLDTFILVLTEVTDLSVVDGVCEINGTVHWFKIGWDHPDASGGPNYVDLPGPHYTWSWDWPVSITIDPNGILILFGAPTNELGIVGSTLAIRY